MRTFFKNSYLAIIFFLLYTPILVLMLFSFNSGNSVHSWKNWSLDGYTELFNQTELWQSVSVTLIVAFISTFVAVIIGTFAALGLSKTKKITRNLTLGITNIPLVNADIVTAVSLMLLFLAFGFSFGIVTLILAHISFNIPYVIITVLPKIRSINMSQLEASQDLGATPWYTLRKIVFPTIKPAIIAGAAIAFAMSFDDFLISYFTGGNASNVSTFIYSLKVIKPYVNAFSTIIILIIVLMVMSWNGYVVFKKQIKQRNEKIDQGIYYDKRIIKIEKTLTKCYLQLNNFINKKNKTKKQKTITNNNNFGHISEADIIFCQQQIIKNRKLIAQIKSLEAKIATEWVWIQQIKTKIKKKKHEKEIRSKNLREKYHFLLWPWKIIVMTIVLTSSFIGLGAFYVSTNVYDLSVFNWGEYMNPTIIKQFEQEYQVKVKYSTFDDNESLYTKLHTTNYDLMVPSDYMVAKLASEDKILKIATTDPKTKITTYDSRLDFNPTAIINPTLNKLINDYPVIDKNGVKSANGLNDYSIPYFWGDIVLVINTTDPTNLTDFDLTEQTVNQANWDILQRAVLKGKRLVLNDDMRNIFMPALSYLHYTNKWGPHTGKDNINPHSTQEISDAADWLAPIFKNNNTKLVSDNMSEEIRNPNDWDIAVMYNGDLLSAFKDNPQLNNGTYKVIRPDMGTNIWNDDMVISKDSPHQDLAFKFINFIMRENQQTKLSREFGYTSPVQAIMNTISEERNKEWKHVYIPTDGQICDQFHPKGYFNGLYIHQYDEKMQTAYNRLNAR